MVFHEGLSDRKSPQISRTHLRVLTILSNADILIVSTRPPTSILLENQLVFRRSLSDSKSLQVSRILRSILDVPKM